MPRALARLKYPINYPHDVAKLRLEYDTPAPVTVDVDAIRRFEEGRIIYESPLIDYHSYLKLVQPIVRDGLVAEWLFFEGAGSVLHDTSGYENHGTIYGMTWQQLANGKWVGYFDGVDDYVAISKMPDLTGSSFTFEALVKVYSWMKYSVIMGEGYQSGRDTTALLMTDDTPGKFIFSFFSDDLAFGPLSGVDPRGWIHVTAVFDADALEQRGYINAKLVRTRTPHGAPVLQTTTWRIGSGVNTARPFNGLIALIRIYSRALSEDEIRELYELARHVVPLG